MMINVWRQEFFISTETIATVLAVLTSFPHILMFIWAGYSMSSYIHTICHCGLKRRVLVKFSLINCKKGDYEEVDNTQLKE